MIDKIKALIREKDTCVLATVAADGPHCSLMSYVTDEDGRNIYMISLKDTKKYRNLMNNAAVSLLIDTRDDSSGRDRQNTRALTIRGDFQLIEAQSKKDIILQRLLDRHPQLKDFAGRSDVAVFQVKPKSFELLEGVSNAYFVEMV